MKDEILKFRKVCEILKTDKGYKNPKLIADIGVSEPTFYKLINSDVNELKIQASVLGLVQDFNKKHRDDVAYAGIITGPVKEPKQKEIPEGKFMDLSKWMTEIQLSIKGLKEEIQKIKDQPVVTATLERTGPERREIPIDIEILINGKPIQF